ncbi:MAG: sulfatase family protein [Ardenticatenaceae bacterium]
MSLQPNIIFLAIDTLRADHLGCYRYRHNTSPRIDQLASEGVLCEKFFCAGAPTYPSFTTTYTGQHPLTHGIVAHGGKNQLDKEAPFLTQLLLEEGYTTCAVDNLNRARSWFMRGYEFYIDPSVRRALVLGVTCEELNNRAIPWLRMHADEQFFLFIHYWDPHWPYTPPARYRNLFYNGGNPTDPNNRALEPWWQTPLGSVAQNTWLRTSEGLITDPAYVEALYDAEIRHLDDGIGQIMDTLDELGIAGDTLIVFFGDHGESLTEHGIFFDHHGLYENTIRVPMILRWPGTLPAGKRLPQMLQHHDIAPTVLDAADMDIPSAMDGRSFWSLATGDSDVGGREWVATAESTRMAKWSLRTERHKFILARHPDFYGFPPRELYDLENDPEETHNLVDEQPELAAQLEQKLEDWIATRLAELGKTEDPVQAQGISLGWEMF